MERDFLIYSAPGLRLFAVPDDRAALQRAALDRFHPCTGKRRLYRHLAGLGLKLGVGRWVRRTAERELAVEFGFDFSSWVSEASSLLGCPDLAPLLFWPPGERARFYVHLLNPDLHSVAFAKISLADYNDAFLEREAATLGWLGRDPLAGCRIPRLLAVGAAGEHRYLLMEPLPAAAKPVPPRLTFYPEVAARELAKRRAHLPAEGLAHLSWWAGYEASRTPDGTRFHDELLRLARGGVRVCQAHGDLKPANLFLADGTAWIIDWEESCPDAPVAADRLGFEMNINGMAQSVNGRALFRLFDRHYLRRASATERADLLLALAFRRTRRHREASLIIENWER